MSQRLEAPPSFEDRADTESTPGSGPSLDEAIGRFEHAKKNLERKEQIVYNRHRRSEPSGWHEPDLNPDATPKEQEAIDKAKEQLDEARGLLESTLLQNAEVFFASEEISHETLARVHELEQQKYKHSNAVRQCERILEEREQTEEQFNKEIGSNAAFKTPEDNRHVLNVKKIQAQKELKRLTELLAEVKATQDECARLKGSFIARTFQGQKIKTLEQKNRDLRHSPQDIAHFQADQQRTIQSVEERLTLLEQRIQSGAFAGRTLAYEQEGTKLRSQKEENRTLELETNIELRKLSAGQDKLKKIADALEITDDTVSLDAGELKESLATYLSTLKLTKETK
ncbi:MAG: hypothetical protein WCK01_04665 [Candidatus Uhrbacteria bacterium]